MKQFAIAINSEKEYNRVKEYAEKWGYEFWSESNGFKDGHKFVIIDLECTPKTFNPCHTVDDCYTPKNWRKAIRKHSPLKLENICVRIDTVDRVKEVWDIVRESGKRIFEGSKGRLISLTIDEQYPFLAYNCEFTETGSIGSRTEIPPKQLAQILGVKQKADYGKHLNADIDFIGNELKRLHNRIDKLAKNYKILENTDEYATRKELKAVNDKLRKRIYDLEQKASKQEVEYKELPLLKTDVSIPKIAIRVENEQEFNNLMEIYEVLGWKRNSLRSPVRPASNLSFPNHVLFKNYFTHTTEPEDCGYTIIPFSQIKNLV